MFSGLRTAIYQVTDIAKAKEWYSLLLGKKPYFDQPFYVGYNVGGFELGLHPSDEKSTKGGTGVVAYWGVDNADAAFKRLLALGATEHSAAQDVGEGIRVATVVDPFGNLIGIIENPHFKIEDAR